MSETQDATGARQRRRRRAEEEDDDDLPNRFENAAADKSKVKPEQQADLRETYYLTRSYLLRYIGFIYLVAFLVAFNQNAALLGRKGLLPVDVYFRRILTAHGQSRLAAFSSNPTLLLFSSESALDQALQLSAGAGLVLSLVVTLTGAANMLAMAALWILYHSVVGVGQQW